MVPKGTHLEVSPPSPRLTTRQRRVPKLTLSLASLMQAVCWLLPRLSHPGTFARLDPVVRAGADRDALSRGRAQEAKLPADRPYIFGYHPHGVIGMGAIAKYVRPHLRVRLCRH